MINLWYALDEFEKYIGKTEPNRTAVKPLSRNEVLVLTLFIQWIEANAPEYAAAPELLAALDDAPCWPIDSSVGQL